MAQMRLSTNRNRLTDEENKLVVVKGEGVGGMGSLGLVDENYYILELVSNEVLLLYSMGNHLLG